MADPIPNGAPTAPVQPPRPVASNPQGGVGQQAAPPVRTSPTGGAPAPAPQNQQLSRPRAIITNPPSAEVEPPAPEKEPELPAATRAEMEAGRAALERKR